LGDLNVTEEGRRPALTYGPMLKSAVLLLVTIVYEEPGSNVVNGDNEPGIYVEIVINVLGLGRLMEHNEVLYEVKGNGSVPSCV